MNQLAQIQRKNVAEEDHPGLALVNGLHITQERCLWDEVVEAKEGMLEP